MNVDKLIIDMDTRLSVNPDLVLRIEDDDCALLFDPANGRVQMLNATAVEVWRLLDGHRSLKHVIECLKQRYEGIDNVGEAQVLALTERLADLGAVGVWEQA